ncbi:MAG: S9 family peptidase [Pseudomonadota bacterium]
MDDFMAQPMIRDMALSPDGTHLAIVLNKGNRRYVNVHDITKPDMPVVGAMHNDLVRPNFLYWGNNDRLLIAMTVPIDMKRVLKDQKSNSDFDINQYASVSRMIAANKDMSNIVVLLEEERRLHRNRSLSRVTNFVKNDDDHVLIDAFRNDRRLQYLVNINTGTATQVARGSSRTMRFFNDDDGKPQVRLDYLWRSKAIDIFEFTEKGKWKKIGRIYLNRDDEDSLDTTGLIALVDDQLVYRRQNEETGYYELTILNRDTGEKESLVSLVDQDVQGVLYTSRTDSIVGYMTEEDYVRHHYFDEGLQQLYDSMAKQIGGNNFRIEGYSNDLGVALVQSWGMDNPLSYHLWNERSGQMTFLGQAFPKIASDKLALPALATYKTRDGVAIRSYMLFPDNYVEGEPHPTIILPHGGPHARSRATYDTFTQFLATRGYVVVEPNFRGSSGYGRDFEEAGYREWGGVMQDDLTDAVDFLVRKGIADPDRVCIVGFSYGGYAALMGAIKTPNLFRCAISLNGVTHLADMLQHDMNKRVDKEDWQKLLFDRIGHPKDDRAELDANSPALHANRIQIPILLVAGTADEVVPYSQARRMQKALKKADVDFEFISLRDTGHNPVYWREDIEVVYPAVEAFLAKHLRSERLARD